MKNYTLKQVPFITKIDVKKMKRIPRPKLIKGKLVY